MKKVFVLFFLTILFGIYSSKSQTGLNSISTDFSKEKLEAVKFIDDISFTPASVRPANKKKILQIKTSGHIETDESISSASRATEKVTATQVKYAMMMDVNIESLTNLTLYKFIEEWFGTRYRMGGKTRKGIDCSAFSSTLLLAVYALSLPRTAKLQYKSCEQICKEDLLEGDLVFFNTRGGVSHVGVYLANGYFVHSASSRGVMISSLDDCYFSKRFIGGGRVN